MASEGKQKSPLVPVAAFALLALGLVAVNVLAAYVPLRLDVTQEGLYTLSEGSREIVGSLEEPMTLKLYYSQSLADIPPAFKTYSTKVIDLLREYAANGRGKVSVEIYDPKPDSDDEEWATRYGLSAARLPNGSRMFFGMVALSAEREATVPFFDPRREKFLEYDISQSLSRIRHSQPEKLGVLSYLPIGGFGGPMMGGPGAGQDWAVMRELQKSYEVQMLLPDKLVEIADDVGLVLVIHPKIVPERISYALDQYLMRGGRMIVFVDPNSRLDPGAQNRFGAPSNSNLKTLFKAWGIKYQSLMVVGDHELATRVNTPRFGVVDYPIWLTLNPKYLDQEHVITSELEELTFIDAGAFETAEDFAYTFTPLITSSARSALVDFTTVRMANPVTIAKMVQPDGKTRVLAALMSGRFESAFPGGPPPAPKLNNGETKDKEKPPERKYPHLAQAKEDTTVVLVADSDFMGDQFSIQQVSFFGTLVTQPINDNLNFVLNAVEFMMGGQALIHIRSRGRFSRPFTRVANLHVAAADQYLTEEQRLSDQLEEVKRKLDQIEREKPKGQEPMLSAAQLEAVKQYRLEEQRTRKALRDVRKVLRQDVEALGNTLLVINLLAMPILVALAGFVIIFLRTRRSGGRR